ncbi:flagellar hook-basal body protein [bacterium]|nr:flagellar hook-basal body protein [bacterium]
MIKGLYHSATGMLARQRNLEAITNNLANASTVGFKAEKVVFRSMLDQAVEPHPAAMGQAYPVAESANGGLTENGGLKHTGNPLDVAVQGNGFFVVETGSGLAYTRDGRFQLNASGELVTSTGYRVMTEQGMSYVPDGDLKSNQVGELYLKPADAPAEQALDRLLIVGFDSSTKMSHLKDGLLTADQEPIQLELPNLHPGFIEESNVNIISQMADMLHINKLYEAAAKTILAQDTTLGKAVNELGAVK